tara:strand:- start:15398 stop:17470 length:2073 start_codon:yes stop_codon:yes gene_type:complete
MNRLSDEKSPYLQQHSTNPVDWYPWGDNAFSKAIKEDKPIFLSIGYATCHWCHVMEHESFEDEDVAELMNRVFVNIKVDREERPDIDHTYMTICQMLTGQGGWPLTIVMTPDRKPFFAATYLPKVSRPQRIGMLDLIPAIQKAWLSDRENVLESVERIKQGFTKTLDLGKGSSPLPENITAQAQDELSVRFDEVEGGFGTSPKFPSAHNLTFLINQFHGTGDKKSLHMAEFTLNKMRLGGIWDHIGYGFHRYSTDREWLLPHFEKMLYDQAMLLFAYAECWRITDHPLFRQTIFELTEYIDECLTSPEGAFYSAEDADSEGEEGKFYVWNFEEIQNLLSPEESELFINIFEIADNGNFRDESTGQKTGANIPHLKFDLFDIAKKTDRDPNHLKDKIDQIRLRLKKEREKRIRPLLDDKILTDWNGLMIASLARAGSLLNEEKFIKKAENAWETINHYCVRKDHSLLHRLKDGDAAIAGMADDYAFLVYGLIELYQATFKPIYLETAINIQERFDDLFYDKEFGGYFFTSKTAVPLLGRQKEIYDGAIPSSNSVAALNLSRLFSMTGKSDYNDQFQKLFQAFSDPISDAPAGYTAALQAWEQSQNGVSQIIITLPEFTEDTVSNINKLRKIAPPGSTFLLKTNPNADHINKIAEMMKNYEVKDQLTIYVCSQFVCKNPVHSYDEAIDMLTQ